MSDSDLDQAIEQFQHMLEESGDCVACRDMGGELYEVSPEAVVEALLAAGWRPPEVAG